MIRRSLVPILSLLIALILLTGCLDINIINLAEIDVRVRIQTPDGGNYTKVVKAGGTASSFSEHGGAFTISTLPNEAYIQLLKSLREEISLRLFTETSTLSAEDVKTLVARLNEINQALDSLKDDASCSGSAPDFSTVSAFISWDEQAEKWRVECSVDTGEE